MNYMDPTINPMHNMNSYGMIPNQNPMSFQPPMTNLNERLTNIEKKLEILENKIKQIENNNPITSEYDKYKTSMYML